MSTGRHEEELEQDATPREATAHAGLASGVVPKGMFDASGELCPPPWSVVRSFVLTGEHRDWIEAYIERSPAFADVLEALANDHEERTEARRRSHSRR